MTEAAGGKCEVSKPRGGGDPRGFFLQAHTEFYVFAVVKNYAWREGCVNGKVAQLVCLVMSGRYVIYLCPRAEVGAGGGCGEMREGQGWGYQHTQETVGD
jgi:hypothetical protein